MSSSALSSPLARVQSRPWASRILAVACLSIVLFLGVTSVSIARQAARDEARPAGAIVIFGAAEYSGRPSPVYRARLDHGYDLYAKGIAPTVITTGGAGADPTYTEGGVGRDYLAKRGIPDRSLIAETQSEDTAESAQRIAAILRTNNIHDAVAVSDAYHVFRIKQLMKAQGITAYGSPRPESLPRGAWGRMTGVLREAVSYALWRLHLT